MLSLQSGRARRLKTLLSLPVIVSLIYIAPSLAGSKIPVEFDKGVVYTNHIYVAPYGQNRPDAGTKHFPLKSIRIALKQAEPGTKIHLAAGTYERIYAKALRGTAKAPIAIVGDEKGVRIVSNRAGIYIGQPRYLVLENLYIEGQYNGLNIDDGSDFHDPTAASHVIIRNSTIRATGDRNTDALKVSGVSNLLVINNDLSTAGDRGSGIDMVGCHNVVIKGNTFHGNGASGVQSKGGSTDVLVQSNTFRDFTFPGARAVNAGGSTGERFYRPPLVSKSQDPKGINQEATRINIIANLFLNVQDVVAFTGCVDCLFANNTVIKPNRRIVRLLNEKRGGNQRFDFSPSLNGRVVNNIIYYSTERGSPAIVNIGPDNRPETFSFSNNLWMAYNKKGNFRTLLHPKIPAEKNGYHQVDPGFKNLTKDFHLKPGSKAIGKGSKSVQKYLTHDFDGKPYKSPPSLGAFEAH